MCTLMQVMNDLVVDRGPNPYLTNLTISCNGRKMTSVQGDGNVTVGTCTCTMHLINITCAIIC